MGKEGFKLGMAGEGEINQLLCEGVMDRVDKEKA